MTINRDIKGVIFIAILIGGLFWFDALVDSGNMTTLAILMYIGIWQWLGWHCFKWMDS